LNFNIEKSAQLKASEVRTFFLYLALPILKHYLPDKHIWNLTHIIIGKIKDELKF
jgi:hypothetical protein